MSLQLSHISKTPHIPSHLMHAFSTHLVELMCEDLLPSSNTEDLKSLLYPLGNNLTKPYPIISPPEFNSFIINLENISNTMLDPSTCPNHFLVVPNAGTTLTLHSKSHPSYSYLLSSTPRNPRHSTSIRKRFHPYSFHNYINPLI